MISYNKATQTFGEMSDIRVCRVCLRTHAKMYNFDDFRLKQYYEEVIAEMVKDDGLPRFFCYECAMMLHKFHKFKEKCHIAQKTLQSLLWRGSITLQEIYKIDLESVNLKSSIDIINKSNRVKTCIFKHSECEAHEQTGIPSPEMVSLNEDSDVISPKSVDFDVTQYVDDDDNYDDEDNIIVSNIPKDNTNDREDDQKINIESENIGKDEHETKPTSEDAIIIDDLKLSNEEKTTKESKSSKIIQRKKIYKKKIKKSGTSKKDLDSKNWQKLILPEEEAVKEFEAKAQDPRYINAKYKCTGCLKAFSKEDMMKRHIKLRHESTGPMECRFCHIKLKSKCFLGRHLKEHYNKYKCLRCNLTFVRETSALHHDQYHNGVTRTCEYCNEQFSHLSTYYTHLRKHRSKHICAFCGESFVSKLGLDMHRSVKHIMDTDSQDDAAAQTTYCERCDIKFENNKAYGEHLIHSAMHSASEETPTLMNLKGGSVIKRVPRIHTQCTICNINFSTLTAYTKHHRREHADVPLPVVKNAKIAGATTGNSPESQDRYICEICGALLAASSMYSHVNTHTRERQYTCTTCGMQFNAKGTLQRHYLTHTGGKPVECSLCDKRFTQVASMKLHYRTIHLKEPYPKRPRNRKIEIPEDTSLIAEYYNSKEPTDDMPLAKWRTLRW